MVDYCGVEGVRYIWHNEWADPELVYRDHRFNYHDVEDPLWERFKEECESENRDPYDARFPGWVRRNRGLLFEILENLIAA